MFSNRFNNTKNDPLVEAVQNAMQDGEIRRQAVAYVNEAFGVYNRNAVVREDLAEYDAAIEEAYKCMKEGEKLADKDYDKDGKIESPKDEVWGSRFRAAKMAGKMEEEQIDEISKDLATRYFKKATKDARYAPQDKAVKRFAGAELAFKKKWGGAKVAATEETQIDELTKPTAKTAHKVLNRSEDDLDKSAKAANRLYSWKMKRYPGKTKKYSGTAELPGAGNVEMHQDKYPGYVTKAGKLTKSATKDTKREIKDRLGKHAKPNLPEETDYSAPDRAAVTRDNKPSTPAQTNAATSGPSAADKAALKNKIKTMQEAAYSAKAARAGKDIGKPGKEFKKIAKSAAARYGSEKRGKKVAGAILKRIRAKHMKEENLEELSAFGKAFAAAKGQNFTFGGKQYSGAMKGQTGSSSAPKAAPVDAPSPKSQTGSSRMDALKSITNPTPTVSKTQNMGSSISTGGSSAMDAVSALSAKQAATPGERTAPVNKMQNMGSSISTGGSSAMDKISSMGAAQSSDTQKAKDVAKGVTSFAQQSSITGGIGAASSPKDSRNKFSVDENKALRESVQVGTNKYRIV